ncbi:MAG: 4-(cytidine 5'-diphospho)-2-C-methyl-D-erythritol kinase [Terriglobia bacterium]
MPSAWLALPAFAKINLALELLGTRADGYQEVRTLYQTVTLHDRLRLRLTRARRDATVRVLGGGAPSGRRNLVARLLSRARRVLDIRPGVEVELEKSIPAGRGLGGGSSDAAAALVGLLRLTGATVSLAEASGLCAAAGADVPFFLLGGRALGVGRGEEVYPLQDAGPAYCVLLCPPQPVATRSAYGWVAGRAARLTPRRAPAIIRDWRRRPGQLCRAGNDFEPVIFQRFPLLARMKRALLRAGARHAGLSGSGSTVYALFTRRVSAERAARPWTRAATVFTVELLPRGRYRQALGVNQVVREA